MAISKIIVPYPPLLRCPKCDSARIKTTGTQTPTRFHVCRDCGSKFRSYEQSK